MVVVDPCPSATLTINPANPFYTGTPFQYVLGDAAPTKILYDRTQMFTTSTSVYCGDLKIDFINANGNEYDTEVFSELTTVPTASEFIAGAGPLTNILKAKDYELKFKVYYSQYTSNFVASNNFIFAIVDSCDPHNSYPQPTITATEQPAQTFTITVDDTWTLTPFTTVPAICASRIVYSYVPATNSPTTVGTQGQAITFNNVDTYSFSYSGDTDLSGKTAAGKVYQITVIGTISSQSTTAPVQVTIKSPCLNSSLLSLSSFSVPSFTYYLYSTTNNVQTHTASTIVASQPVIDICGAIEYTLTTTNPAMQTHVTYVEAQKSITVYVDDPSLMTPSPFQFYTVTASLVEYPSRTKDASSFIQLLDPCLAPTSLSAASSLVSGSSDYSNAVNLALPEVTVQPSQCLQYATYTCTAGSNAHYTGGQNLCG